MAQFRKKSLVIEAIEFTSGDKYPEVKEWLRQKIIENAVCGLDAVSQGYTANDDICSIAINTLEGTMIANPGDWIICGIKGELYPIKPDIFAESYEPV